MQQPFHFFLLLFLISSPFLSTGVQALNSYPVVIPSASISTTWTNSIENGQTISLVLSSLSSLGPYFGCGFICRSVSISGSCRLVLFSIFLGINRGWDPQIVWSANRERPVRENATMEFSKNGDLVLRDFDGTTVWSTNTSGKSVVGMKLTEAASLVLFDDSNKTVWSPMDYPTDSLVLGQTLREGQRLTANISITYSSQGPLYLTELVVEIIGYNSSAFIKVQSFSNTNSTSSTTNTHVSKGKKVSTRIIVAASVGALLACFLIALCVITLVMRRCSYRENMDDDEFDMLPGLHTRFAFEDLRIATNDFLRKLGEGGFGSVFEGTLIDGTKIAVKRLDGVGQGKKEFLAEVETIGSIHHLHLVRLVGFCAEKSFRLLIYEYMLNGSLDKWIFYKDHDTILDWQTRRKIITDIAKGLTYLHEECRQKIVHLDIKPQNILLDANFNAKVSDFGLAKLIDRDQIEVMTRMRGTPGYLAPEWLTSIITEKVDVFSFGVVVLEIVCGRRNLDYSKDDECIHLIGLLQRKVAENKLVDLVDCRCTDMKVHIKDVIMVVHLAMWCLQSDYNKRPLMSAVLKVLEGSMEVEADLDYTFSNLTSYIPRNANIIISSLPQPSILSRPR